MVYVKNLFSIPLFSSYPLSTRSYTVSRLSISRLQNNSLHVILSSFYLSLRPNFVQYYQDSSTHLKQTVSIAP